MTASEGLNDTHVATAVGAWFAQGQRGDLRVQLRFLFGLFNPKQSASFCNICLSCGTGEQAIVADAVEPVWQHMDQKASDELASGKAHD